MRQEAAFTYDQSPYIFPCREHRSATGYNAPRKSPARWNWRSSSPDPARRAFPGTVSTRSLGLPSETFEDLLKALVTAGQVKVMQADGQGRIGRRREAEHIGWRDRPVARLTRRDESATGSVPQFRLPRNAGALCGHVVGKGLGGMSPIRCCMLGGLPWHRRSVGITFDRHTSQPPRRGLDRSLPGSWLHPQRAIRDPR